MIVREVYVRELVSTSATEKSILGPRLWGITPCSYIWIGVDVFVPNQMEMSFEIYKYINKKEYPYVSMYCAVGKFGGSHPTLTASLG